MSRALADTVNKTRGTMWIWVFFLAILLFFTTFWGVTASSFSTSDHWSVDFVCTGALLLYFFVPLTLGFALDSPFREWRRTLHVVLVIILFLCGVVIVGFWGFYYNKANNAEASNAKNPANDPRWCDLYFNLPGSGCTQTQTVIGLVPSMLVVNPVFLWKFWFFVVFMVLLIVDFALVVFLLEPVVRMFLSSSSSSETESGPSPEPLLETPTPAPSPTNGGGGGSSQEQSVNLTYIPGGGMKAQVMGPFSTRMSRPQRK